MSLEKFKEAFSTLAHNGCVHRFAELDAAIVAPDEDTLSKARVLLQGGQSARWVGQDEERRAVVAHIRRTIAIFERMGLSTKAIAAMQALQETFEVGEHR